MEALICAAPNPRARLLFLIEWRADLRISEALAVGARHLLHGRPISVLSGWLDHASIHSRLIYLVPDPTGSLASVR